MNASPSNAELGRELRRIAKAHDQAQQARLRVGEQIRELIRREKGTGSRPPAAEALLGEIRRGEQDGPAPLLGRSYRRHWEEEQETARLLSEWLELHPAWPWLRRVRGVGATLAGRLLARLDVTRADTPSSFWAYCGLGTVPGVEYRCPTCGMRGTFPERQRVSGRHTRPGGSEPCPDRLRAVAGPEQGVRVAQPKPVRGHRASYDLRAKKTCFLIGNSLLRSGGPFEQYYRRERSRLDETRPDWNDGRKHLTALRKMEKLFLAQLWIVWRQEVGLPITQPYGHGQEEHDRWIDPWEMVAPPQQHRWSHPQPSAPAQRAQA